jgi:anti-anti-sigma regulatory factor
VLLALEASLKQRGLSLMVKNDNPQVREYLKLSGLSDYFPLVQASEVVVQRGA